MMELLEDLHYEARGGIVYTAYAGLRFDGKSTPRATWILRLAGPPFVGRCRRAAVIHDQKCKEVREYFKRTGDRPGAARMRLAADKLFLEILEVDGVGRLKRRAMYRGVRIGATFEGFGGKHCRSIS